MNNLRKQIAHGTTLPARTKFGADIMGKLTDLGLSQKGLIVFARELLSNPAAIGAACPSSKKLARTIARQIPMPELGNIVELGAGTGVVTQALLDQGLSPRQIYVVERAKKLCRHLHKRFPDMHIIHGDAVELQEILGEASDQVDIIVSSLPFRSLPKQIAAQIEAQITKTLKKGGLMIQFTYDIRKNSVNKFKLLRHIYSKNVWFNIPPARVDVYKAP